MSDIRNDFAPGVITGTEVKEIFALAKASAFAIPACNVTGTNTMNGVMEAAAAVNSPVIIQFSHGGSAFVGGKSLANADNRASILGALAGADHVNRMAAAYGARVILHTDHCAKKLLGWVDGLLDVGEKHYAATGKPLFSSHMLDLSEEPLEENVEISKRYLERMSAIGMTLEIELGITGGEEDGVDNSDADDSDLYTKPEEVAYVYDELMKVSDRFTDRGGVRQRARRLQARQRQAQADRSCARARSTSRPSSAPPSGPSTSCSTAGPDHRRPRSPRPSATA